MSTARDHHAIAIVGIGCRLPGGADDPATLWRLLGDGFDAIGEVPPARFDVEALYDPQPATPGRIMSRFGGFLRGVEDFDADAFGIAPREAERLDPQQRLLLETAFESLDDAGIARERVAGTNTGVFVGVWLEEMQDRLVAGNDDVDFYMTTGTGRYAASGRVSYLLDAFGPSLTIDTACSSSLVAVHLAVQCLQSGECDLALAGGANVILEPSITIAYSQSRMMAPDGRCKFGDAAADGYVRSDGAAIVTLKRLVDAVADGDRIYATIIGSAVTNDGRSGGFLATPGGRGQEEMLRRAYERAGVAPSSVQYVEAHGTGTATGDPVELGALGAVVGAGRPDDHPCLVGSIKSNVGHTEGAAGVAGLIKVALSLAHAELPASLHVQRPNPEVPWDQLGLEVCTSQRPWPTGDTPRRAGVSAFGIAGTNAHVVLEEAPPRRIVEPPAAPLVLPISAHDGAALGHLAAAYGDLVASSDDAGVAGVCAAAALRRTHLGERLAVTGAAPHDLVDALAAASAGDPHPGAARGRAGHEPPLLAFVFPGQGSQWVGMGRRLLATDPVFRRSIEQTAAALAAHVRWDLVDQLTADDPPRDPSDIDVVQPCVFAVQVALAARWRAWGVHPDVVVGHSMGEVAAAHVAGILTLDDAARVIARRSGLLRRISGRGAMAVVGVDRETAAAALAGSQDRLAVAVSNSPGSTVLSGDPAALEEVMARFAAADVFTRRVKVDVASHSPQVDELTPDLLSELAPVAPTSGHTTFHSTVTGEVARGEDLDARYWVRNLRQPVLFGDVVRQLGAAGGRVLVVELSAHPMLLAPVGEVLGDAVTVPSMVRDCDDAVALAGALGAVYAGGYDVDWRHVHGPQCAAVDLPRYPWQRERHWLAPPAAAGSRRGQRDDALLGWALPLADGRVAAWDNELDRRIQPGLYEHHLAGVPSAPPAAIVELLARAAAGGGPVALEGVAFERPLRLDDEPTAIQVVVGDTTVALHRRAGDEWERIAVAVVAASDPAIASPPDPGPTLAVRAASEVYADLRAAGAELGPAHRVLGDVRTHAGHVSATVATDLGLGLGALLDAAFQLAMIAGSETLDGRPVAVPVAVTRVEVAADTPGPHLASAIVRRTAGAGAVVDVVVTGAAGEPSLSVEGIAVQALDAAAVAPPERWCLATAWSPAGEPRRRIEAVATWLVLGDADGLAASTARALAAGGGCVVVEDGRALDVIARDLPPVGAEVVDLRALDAVTDDAVGAGAAGLADLVSALRAGGVMARIWAVTRGAHRTDPADPPPVPAQAAVWGLGRAVAEEAPELWAGLVDLDPAADADTAAAALVATIVAGTGEPAEDEVALRGAGPLVPRLVEHAPAPAAAPGWRRDASYLITGGFGALGTHAARWLVANGARRVVLLGRTALPARERWTAVDAASAVGRRVATVREIEAMGAAVHVIAVDVADRATLAAALEEFAAAGWPPIAGVFHAAASLAGGLLGELRGATVGAELAAKVDGALALDGLLPDLDHFVLFSSIAALLPTAGQAAYAAGNAALDALAERRRAAGRPALSVGWGFWEGSFDAPAGGLQSAGTDDAAAVSYKAAARELAAAHGVGAFSPAAGLGLLARLLGDAATPSHVVVSPIDAAALAASPAGRRGIAAALVAERRAEAAPAGTGAIAGPLTPDDAREMVRSIVGAVLKLPGAKLDDDRPFGTLGMDSMMALDLRNRLQRATGLLISATVAWNYPTVAALTGHLLAPLGHGAPAEAADPAANLGATDPDLAAARDAVAALSDEDVMAELMGGAS